MFLLTIGSALMYMFATDAFEVAEKQPASVYYSHPMDTRVGSGFSLMEPIEVPEPLTEKLFKNIVHQAYDYSCGSAALTNLLNGYVGRQFTEKQVMDGLLKFGEYDKIVQRRGFSLLDMKRLVTALGHQSNGFKGTLDELKKLDHPAIVAIHYMNFKHFVIVKKYQDGRFFIADPSLGNLSFPEAKFDQIWEKKDGKGNLFIVFPGEVKTNNALELTEDDMRFVSDETLSYLASLEIFQNYRQTEHNADRSSSLRKVFNADTNATSTNQVIEVQLRSYFNRK